MKLYEEKKIDLYDVVSYYIPEFEKNGKKYIRIRNLLLHNSGLRAWIPFYQTCESKDDVINAICDETLVSEPGEVTIYSDLNAVLLGEIIERVTGMSLDDYCELEIFKPLGMNNTFSIQRMSTGIQLHQLNTIRYGGGGYCKVKFMTKPLLSWAVYPGMRDYFQLRKMLQ